MAECREIGFFSCPVGHQVAVIATSVDSPVARAGANENGNVRCGVYDGTTPIATHATRGGDSLVWRAQVASQLVPDLQAREAFLMTVCVARLVRLVAALAASRSLILGSFGAPSVSARGLAASVTEGRASSRVVTKLLVVVEENHSLSQMHVGMPYTYSLAQRFGYATNYHAITHPSLPNYLAIVNLGHARTAASLARAFGLPLR
jgi:hypothetical protein